ncbi:MAG TPA: hypothetical protein VGH28_21655 [Polyangiaceae bacterium]|jgi:uncharacterized protein involved in exopolysaccharide biosynthesis
MPPIDEPRRSAQRGRSRRPEEEDEDEGLDLSHLKDVAGYVLRAPRRQPRRFAVWAAVGVVLGAATWHYYPRTYATEVKILAKRNLVLPALDNPTRAVPREADNPTKDVGTTMLQHDNMVGLIKEVDLLDRWEATRPPLLRAKDALLGSLHGPGTDADRMRAIEGVLEKRLSVTSDDTTITITVEWTDGQMAYDLAEAVEKNFIEAHYDSEVNVINDAISILEQHASDERKTFDAARNEFEQAESKSPSSVVTSPQGVRRVVHVAPTGGASTAKPAVDPQLLADLDAKRASIKTMEDQRSARIAELNRQLSDALVSMAPGHPAVIALKQRIADAQVVPPELAQLHADERVLIDKLAATAPPPSHVEPLATTTTVSVPAPASALSRGLIEEEDPAVTVARMKLQTSAQKLSDLQSRIDSAKIELDIAKTAHKYRFNIVHPAEVSSRPRKPNPFVLAFGILFGVLLLAFGSVVRNERSRGKFLEEWQLRRRLKLPVLGEIES